MNSRRNWKKNRKKLLFGMVSGVYSTICIATPLWVDWKNKKKAAKKA